MRGKGNRHQQEEEDYEEEGPSSFATTNNSNSNNTHTTTGKDGKSIDKVNAMRSKHSVTEQRRRSKINERFQILRDLIPHSDQKRDTASFLLEVIEYVQYLQEKVHKYEGQYPGWSPEPTKLMPWKNSHWRSQSFVGNVQAMKNGSGPGSTFHEHNSTISPTILPSAQNPSESDPNRDSTGKSMEQQSELVNRGMPHSTCLQNFITNPLRQPVSDAQSAEYTTTHEPLIQPEELTIEGGTISISSTYSEGLLNTLTQALQTAGVDLSQANISVQIDIGNRANRGLTCTASTAKDSQNEGVTHLRDHSSGEELDPPQKRLKT